MRADWPTHTGSFGWGGVSGWGGVMDEACVHERPDNRQGSAGDFYDADGLFGAHRCSPFCVSVTAATI